MIREQIYINGHLMEQEVGKRASLVFQSPLFTDIDAIVSNRSNSIDFPKTDNNLKAIDDCHLTTRESKYAYRKHDVRYYLDGVQVFRGFGTLLSITDKAIRFSFTWGNVNAFKKLLEVRVRDLQGAEDYAPWNDAEIAVNSRYATNISYGREGHAHPVLHVSDILARLTEQSGVQFEGAETLSDLALPLVSARADIHAMLAQGPHFTDGYEAIDLGGQTRYNLTPSSDLEGLHIGGGVLNVSEVQKIRISAKAGSTISWRGGDGIIVPKGCIGVFATDENGDGNTLITAIQFDYTASGSDKTMTLAEDVVRDIDLNWSEGKYNYIRLQFLQASFFLLNLSVNVDISVAAGIDEEEHALQFGGVFPLYYNLPDWDASQLLKNLMKVRGLFAQCPDEHTIRFISVDSVYNARLGAFDWTERLVLDKNQPAEQTPTYGSYAQSNLCKWASDDTNTQTFDGALVVENETLAESADLLSLDFAGTEGEDVLRINAYALNDDGEVEFTEVVPRLVQMEGRRASFAPLDWKNIGGVGSRYESYQGVIRTPRYIKAKVMIDALELAEMDLTVPVYSSVLGHYYAIVKVTTKDAYMADVELLELPEYHAGVDTPTSDRQTYELIVDVDAEGNHFATIPGLSGTQLNKMISSPDYKCVLLRYGYARRGMAFQYTDAQGNLVWSHADRKPNYKHLRGGLKYRIIGENVLVRGAEKAWSQQSKTGAYANSTLVFELKDSIALPLVNFSSALRTKSGRIANRSRIGLVELWVALYHKEGKQWRLCSNRVQVRGRNDDKTRLWEWHRSNYVDVV